MKVSAGFCTGFMVYVQANSGKSWFRVMICWLSCSWRQIQPEKITIKWDQQRVWIKQARAVECEVCLSLCPSPGYLTGWREYSALSTHTTMEKKSQLDVVIHKFVLLLMIWDQKFYSKPWRVIGKKLLGKLTIERHPTQDKKPRLDFVILETVDLWRVSLAESENSVIGHSHQCSDRIWTQIWWNLNLQK